MGEQTKVALIVNERTTLEIIQKDLGLPAIIESIKQKYKLFQNGKFGLVVVASGNPKRHNLYVTEDTFASDVQDGVVLSVKPALEEVVEMIFKTVENPEMTEQNSENIFNLALDPALINELVTRKLEERLLNLLNVENILTSKGRSGCLLVLLKLLQNGQTTIVNENLTSFTVDIVKIRGPETQYALSVLAQILYTRNLEFSAIKRKIIESLSVDHLLPLVLTKDVPDLPLNALMLVNAIVRSVKDEKKASIIKELSNKDNREKVYRLITEGTISDRMGKQLFILQTHLLSTYNVSLSRLVAAGNLDRDSSTYSMDDELFNQWESTTSLYKDNVSRFSLTSISTTRDSFLSEFYNDSNFITQLTFNCIVHYRGYHSKNFCMSQSEENTYEPGIQKSSDRVVNILAQILSIGQQIQKHRSTYVPIFFNRDTDNFFEEIFSRAMYMLSQARREMKARKLEDYEKLIAVLKCQLEMIFERKPRSFKEFGLYMRDINYETVKERWQKEREAEWKIMLKGNPCIQLLAEEFDKNNAELINTHRLSILKDSSIFPKIPEKKHKSQYFKLQLSSNAKCFYYTKFDEAEDVNKMKRNFLVEDIRHFVTGEACHHIKDNSVPAAKQNCVFSIVLPENEVVNCLMSNEKDTNYWIDGFNILLGNPERSVDYKEELDKLTEMDCTLHLLELQNVKLPSTAPPILNQSVERPLIPPKPVKLKNQSSIVLDEDSAPYF